LVGRAWKPKASRESCITTGETSNQSGREKL
jgi:hypothetical protein